MKELCDQSSSQMGVPFVRKGEEGTKERTGSIDANELFCSIGIAAIYLCMGKYLAYLRAP